jgi:hypothetical protein
MTTRNLWIAAAVLLGGALTGCGSPKWALFYKPLAETRSALPYPSAVEKKDGIEVYVGPEAKRIIDGELGENSGFQTFVVEVLVLNKRDEPILFRAQGVSVTMEGKTGTALDELQTVVKPGAYSGRFILNVPVTGRGKADPRDDHVELKVEVSGLTSRKVIAVPVRLLFNFSQSW